MYALAGLLAGVGSQVAVLWGTVLIAKSSALDEFRNLPPGSVGDLVLLLALALGLNAVLTGVLMLALGRHRRRLTVLLLALVLGALFAAAVVLGLASV